MGHSYTTSLQESPRQQLHYEESSRRFVRSSTRCRVDADGCRSVRLLDENQLRRSQRRRHMADRLVRRMFVCRHQDPPREFFRPLPSFFSSPRAVSAAQMSFGAVETKMKSFLEVIAR